MRLAIIIMEKLEMEQKFVITSRVKYSFKYWKALIIYTKNPPLIHRDLKPANILLKKSEAKGICVKIADFGPIAIHEFSGKSHSLGVGTQKYMAPEVIIGRNYNTKADVYSLGVILENLFFLDMDE